MSSAVLNPVRFWAMAGGLLFSTVIAGFFVRLVVDALRRVAEPGATPGPGILSAAQGMTERVLYTACIYFGALPLAGLWLVLKVATQWKRWGQASSHHVFLVGSALSLFYALVGARLIAWIMVGRWSSVIIYPVVVMIATLVLRVWVGSRSKA